MEFSIIVSTVFQNQGTGAIEVYDSDSRQLTIQQPLAGSPSGLAFGRGGLLVGNQSDQFSVITQFGTQTGTFADPPVGVTDLTVDRAGNVFAVSNNRFVQKFDAITGTFVNIFPVGGLGLGIANSITTGPDGYLYISTGRGNVEQVDPNTLQIVWTPVISLGSLAGVRDLAFNAQGTLFLLDGADNTIKQWTAQGAVVVVSGFRSPSSLGFGPNGNLFVVDAGFGGVLELSSTTGQLVQFYQTQGSPRYITFSVPQQATSQSLDSASFTGQPENLSNGDLVLVATDVQDVDPLTGVAPSAPLVIGSDALLTTFEASTQETELPAVAMGDVYDLNNLDSSMDNTSLLVGQNSDSFPGMDGSIPSNNTFVNHQLYGSI